MRSSTTSPRIFLLQRLISKAVIRLSTLHRSVCLVQIFGYSRFARLAVLGTADDRQVVGEVRGLPDLRSDAQKLYLRSGS
jgi:hypothetical protein